MESGIATISDILRVEDCLIPNEHDIQWIKNWVHKIIYNFGWGAYLIPW